MNIAAQAANTPSLPQLMMDAKTKREYTSGVCPSCTKPKSLTHTMNRDAASLAVLAEPSAQLQFQRRGVGIDDANRDPEIFRVCGKCFTVFKKALAVARMDAHIVEHEPKTTRRSYAITLDQPFSFDGGRTTLVSQIPIL
jgi:hypothetical protein